MNTLSSLARKAMLQSIEVIQRRCNPKLLKKDRCQYLVYLFNWNVYYSDNFYIWNKEVYRALCILSAFSEALGGGQYFFGLLDSQGRLIEPGRSNAEAKESIAKIYRVLKAFKDIRMKNLE